jgi:hypothetical protein
MGVYSSYVDERLKRTDDVDIFPILQARDFTAIITRDQRQLYYDEERDGLRAAGLHWVGLSDFKGRGHDFHAQAIGAISAVLPMLLRDAPTEPHAYFITPDHRRALRPVHVERI